MGKCVFKRESRTLFIRVVRMLFPSLGVIIVYWSVLLNVHARLFLTPILSDFPIILKAQKRAESC